jgi:hypothetical protein
VNAIAGGTNRGRHVSKAMNASTTPAMAASDQLADATIVIRSRRAIRRHRAH